MVWLAELRVYIWAVASNWAGLSTGGIIMALIAWKAFLQEGWKPSRRQCFSLIAVFLFIASFQAWKEQRDEVARKLETNKTLEANLKELSEPQLIGEIDQVFGGTMVPWNQSGIMLWVKIRNLGMDSIADGYMLKITIPSGESYHFRSTVIPPKFMSDMGVWMDKLDESALYDKTAESPILRGGAKTGILLFLLNGLQQREVHQVGTRLDLTFVDVKKKVNTIIWIFDRDNMTHGPVYIPGGPKIGVGVK